MVLLKTLVTTTLLAVFKDDILFKVTWGKLCARPRLYVQKQGAE
jgi:hypothetical protein